ncbi:hypothetical protein F4781DRAFT_407062 [Annulohypoxylon bovei var. microspora]|nr:hypothetical protein F4781DRAFT_407062 [Annulohypoxylon bovei var. microspora]
MIFPSLTKTFLLLAPLALLGASTPIDSNGMDRGDGVYIHNDAGEIIDFIAIADIRARDLPEVNTTDSDAVLLEPRKFPWDTKCFSAKFDKNDKRVGLSDLGDIMDRYGTLAAKTMFSVQYYSVITYVCNYSTVRINCDRGTSGKVNAGLDQSCHDNVAARGDYRSGISYGRTAKGKPFCN